MREIEANRVTRAVRHLRIRANTDLPEDHVAAFPVAVNLDCHSHRTASAQL